MTPIVQPITLSPILSPVSSPLLLMICLKSTALAGHAGDTGALGLLPHEVAGALALLAAVGLVLIILVTVAVWLLFRIERNVRRPPPSQEPHP